MDLWNTKYLEPPASSSCKLKNQEINLHELNGLMHDALNVFSSQMFLDIECKMLHTIIKVNKLKFRTTIGFKHLQKLNRCMRIYHEVDYKCLISWFIDLLPRQYEYDTYFPSRNMFDYFLVRSQGIAKLIVRVLECAKQVYIHFMDIIKLGHFIGLGIVIIAVQARIFIICRYLLKCISHLYDTIYALRHKIPNIKTDWLPDNYNLPQELLPWLDIDWAFKEYVIELKGKNRDLFSIDIFDDEDDVEFCKEYKIVDGEDDEDIQIVNEYFNLVDSDDESMRINDEVDDELQIINDEVRTVFFDRKIKEEIQSQVINLDDEIGEPVELNAKVEEVKQKLNAINTLDATEKFIKDGNHNYFRSLGMVRYNHLLNMVQMYKMEASTARTTKKEKKKMFKEVKEKIIQLVQNDETL
ncbi:uncharacterized protein [Atheta coriaria]|uniref:uncharacterized protein n=1 Tax=Dalotia coriaria TaxID=877792 RepID=UPI0031F3FC5E